MIKVGIVGATGYTGVELLRLLAPRDEIEITVVTSRELEGTLVADLFPSLRGHLALPFSAPDSRALGACDVVFLQHLTQLLCILSQNSSPLVPG